jgi:hypothetical protein
MKEREMRWRCGGTLDNISPFFGKKRVLAEVIGGRLQIVETNNTIVWMVRR